MPCVAEYTEPGCQFQPPHLELAAAFAENLREAKTAGDKISFDVILGRAIASAGSFVSNELLDGFKSALPTWADA